MKIRSWIIAGVVAGVAFFAGRESVAQPKPHVYELRTYYTNEGKLPDLQKRFREHTTKLFERHGMKNVIYGVPMDEPQKSKVLVYLLQHDSREAAKASWDKFRADPEWVKVRTASEENGKIVEKVESVFLQPTDYSPMK